MDDQALRRVILAIKMAADRIVAAIENAHSEPADEAEVKRLRKRIEILDAEVREGTDEVWGLRGLLDTANARIAELEPDAEVGRLVRQREENERLHAQIVELVDRVCRRVRAAGARDDE